MQLHHVYINQIKSIQEKAITRKRETNKQLIYTLMYKDYSFRFIMNETKKFVYIYKLIEETFIIYIQFNTIN